MKAPVVTKTITADATATHFDVHGDVTAVATLAHGGRTIATYDIVISDSAGRRVCTSRLTCLIRDRVPDGGANSTGLEREQEVTAD